MTTIDLTQGDTEDAVWSLASALAGQAAYVKANPPGLYRCEINGEKYEISQTTIDYTWCWWKGDEQGGYFPTAAECQQDAMTHARAL